MKRIGIVLATLLLLTLVVHSQTVQTAAAAGPHVHIFVLTGQSNSAPNGNGNLLPPPMKRVDNAWLSRKRTSTTFALSPMEPFRAPKPAFGITGPAFTVEQPIAYYLHQACPALKMVFVRASSGGASIVVWDPVPNTPEWKAAMAAVGNTGKPPMYPWVLSSVKMTRTAVEKQASLAGLPVEVAGVFYVQIERDSKMQAGALQYERRLRDLIDAFRRDWGESDLPVLFIDSHTAFNNYAALTRQAAANVAQVQPQGIADDADARPAPHTGMVAVRDLPTYKDGIHFNSEGLILLGQRMAQGWLELNGGCE